LTLTQQSVAASEEDAQACKQEQKLLKELLKMTNITSASSYKSKAPRHVQDAHALKVRRSVTDVPAMLGAAR
jgi:hypothetical protein